MLVVARRRPPRYLAEHQQCGHFALCPGKTGRRQTAAPRMLAEEPGSSELQMVSGRSLHVVDVLQIRCQLSKQKSMFWCWWVVWGRAKKESMLGVCCVFAEVSILVFSEKLWLWHRAPKKATAKTQVPKTCDFLENQTGLVLEDCCTFAIGQEVLYFEIFEQVFDLKWPWLFQSIRISQCFT